MRTFPKWLGIVLCVAAFLLLLSALIEAPQEETPAPETGVLSVRIEPALLPTADTAAETAPLRDAVRMALILLCAGMLMLPQMLVSRDANGRVVRHRRYEDNSLFDLELAAG